VLALTTRCCRSSGRTSVPKAAVREVLAVEMDSAWGNFGLLAARIPKGSCEWRMLGVGAAPLRGPGGELPECDKRVNRHPTPQRKKATRGVDQRPHQAESGAVPGRGGAGMGEKKGV
jgi:hypothetical protein